MTHADLYLRIARDTDEIPPRPTHNREGADCPQPSADAAPLGHDQVAQGKRAAIAAFVASEAAREAIIDATAQGLVSGPRETARAVQAALLALLRSL